MQFSELGLGKQLQRAISALGYESPFPVQEAAIPAIIAGEDLAVQAPTGSGKTVAFLAPLMQRIIQAPADSPRGPVALVLVPTRELAVQIGTRAIDLARGLSLSFRVRTIFGGVSANAQMQELRGGADLVVATPGRLLDLYRQNALAFGELSFLVLDEADKLLDQGFAKEVMEIRELLPAARQTLLFSATMGTAVAGLVSAFLRNPRHLTVAAPDPAITPAIEERVWVVEPERKGPFLRELLETNDWSQVLVFVNSARRAENVVRKLANNGIVAMALHGEKSQGARTEALLSFRGSLRVLVATDILARGIDVAGLPCVINYELPRSARDYTHRIGRTGRAGQAGLAITLMEPAEESHMRLIENTVKRRLGRLKPDPA